MNDQDVTERKNPEGAMALLASIVESSNDAIFSFTLDGIISSWNPGAQRIYAFTSEQMIGRNISMIVSPNRKDDFPLLLEAVKAGKTTANFVTTHKTKRGR